MAVQYRSQARQGQFAGGLKVPDKATAKRQSDKEEIKALKEQSDALTKRDETLFTRLTRKYESEANTRKIVEQTRREGVEAEKSRRIKNANLAADFAEMEANQKGKDLKALGELIPSLAESAVKIKENRDNYDEEQANIAIQKAGLTDDEWREFRSSSLTADQFSSGTQAWLISLRDQGGITYKQYNAMMQRTGGYGNAMNSIDVQRIAGSFPEWIRRNGDVEDADGLTLNQALRSKSLVDNNARTARVNAAVEEYKRISGWIDYRPEFSNKATKGEFNNHVNNLINTANKTAESQAIQQGIDKDIAATVASVRDGSFSSKYNAVVNPIERHYLLKSTVNNIAEAIKRGELDPNGEAFQKIIDTKVHSEHASGSLGGADSPFPGLRRILRDAEHAHRQQSNQRKRAINSEKDLEHEQQFQGIISTVTGLPTQEQRPYLQNVLADPNVSQAVKKKVVKFTDDRSEIHNKLMHTKLNEMKNRGEPITARIIDVSGITGETLRYWTTYAGSQLAEGQKERHEAVKGDFKTTVSQLTGRKTEFDIGQSAAKEVQRLMFASYLQKVQAYRNTLNPEDAHKQAKFDVIEEFKAGTDPDNPSGPYTYIKDPNNPLKSHFKFIESGVDNVKPLKLAQQYSEHKENMVHIPGSIFDIEETVQWTHPSKVQQKHINRAATIANLIKKGTHATVMRDQMLAAGQEVPQWLKQRAESHEQLILRGASQNTLNNSGLPGVTPEQLKEQVLRDIKVSSLPTYTGDLDGQETGTDHVFQGGVGADLILGMEARIGIPEDGFHHAYTQPDTGGKSFGHTINVVVRLPNGNEVDFMIGHLNEQSPLYGLSPGTIIPAGTRLGGQGMSGSTSGGPVATMHANGRNGYKATPEDLMWIIHNMKGIAGGNR